VIAFKEIEEKLKKLQYPSLFLNNLQQINWQIHNKFGSFSIETTEEKVKRKWRHFTRPIT